MRKLNFKILFFLALLLLVGCASDPQILKTDRIVAVPLHSASNINKKSHLRLLATHAAKRYGISHRLFHALITQESAWNPKAISPVGARGLTQLMPSTAWGECGLKRRYLFNVRANLNCGAFFFSKLLKRFGSVRLALAAYNSGETRVARLGRVPRIRETQHYVKRIMANWRKGS
jgi:soluble lytic murein transglycosylase-like protein